MKAAEIRELSADDLQAKLKEARAELFNLRFQHAINQLENPMRLGAVKKDIALVRLKKTSLASRPRCVLAS